MPEFISPSFRWNISHKVQYREKLQRRSRNYAGLEYERNAGEWTLGIGRLFVGWGWVRLANGSDCTSNVAKLTREEQRQGKRPNKTGQAEQNAHDDDNGWLIVSSLVTSFFGSDWLVVIYRCLFCFMVGWR